MLGVMLGVIHGFAVEVGGRAWKRKGKVSLHVRFVHVQRELYDL